MRASHCSRRERPCWGGRFVFEASLRIPVRFILGASHYQQTAVASAAEAVKGLRSPSLAPMNAANNKTVRVALDCLPRYGWKVHKGSCRSPFETGADNILFKPLFCPTIGERLKPEILRNCR